MYYREKTCCKPGTKILWSFQNHQNHAKSMPSATAKIRKFVLWNPQLFDLETRGTSQHFGSGFQEQITGNELVFSNHIIFCRGNSYRKSFGPELAGHWFSKETNWPRKPPVCFAAKYLDPCCLAHIQSPGTNARPRRPIAAWKIYSQWSTHVATWHFDWMHCNRVFQGSNLSPCPKSSNLVKCQAGFITRSLRLSRL